MFLLLLTDTNKLLMQWKGPYKIVGRCGKGNDYRIEVNKKQRMFHANMLKKYIKRADLNGVPQQNSDDNELMSCDVCTGIVGGNEDLSVNNNEMMDLANCHQKEMVQDVKLGVKLTKTQQEEMMNTLSRHEEVFSDIPGKTNMIKHKIELTQNNPVRSWPYPWPYAMRENLEREMDYMLSFGIIRKSCSPFAFPIVIVEKKNGSGCICVDNWKLNGAICFPKCWQNFLWAVTMDLWLVKYSSTTYTISFGLHGIMMSPELIKKYLNYLNTQE